MFTYILDTVYKREGGFTCLLIYLTLFTRGKEGFTCLLIYLTLFTRGKERVYMFTYILDTVYKREGGGLHVYLYT